MREREASAWSRRIEEPDPVSGAGPSTLHRSVPPQCEYSRRTSLRVDFSNIKTELNVTEATLNLHRVAMHRGRGDELEKPNNDAGLRAGSGIIAGLWAALAAIGAAAFAVEIPFFFQGMPSGHDVEFHLNSWLEVLAQWKEGIYFPRWASWAHFGYGEPRFIFYPPASWTVCAILTAILPWGIVASVYIWISLTLAGTSMFLLVRRWFNPRDAIFAGVL